MKTKEEIFLKLPYISKEGDYYQLTKKQIFEAMEEYHNQFSSPSEPIKEVSEVTDRDIQNEIDEIGMSSLERSGFEEGAKWMRESLSSTYKGETEDKQITINILIAQNEGLNETIELLESKLATQEVKSEEENAIGFAEWILKESWRKHSDDKWIQRIALNMSSTNYTEYVRTTAELYTIYKSFEGGLYSIDDLQYTVTPKMLTQEEYEALGEA